MEAALSRLRSLSADELREEFAKANLKCGPITATTRAIFERKLARALLETSSAGPPEPDSGSGEDGGGIAYGGDATKTSSGASVGEEGDIGYDLGLNPPEEEPLGEKGRTETGERTECCTATNEARAEPAAQGACDTTQVSPTLFYGVCPLWDDMLARSERVHVYTDKKEALQAVKMMKGARFKAFPSREEAERFAKGICDYFPSPNKSTPCVSPVKAGLGFSRESPSLLETDGISRERANSFKSPRTQDLTAKLRRAVEKGDEAAFTELVWSNPRYLIGSGDNPTVVQEGCRYNVMHVAAKENQVSIAQLLLDTLENPEFMRLMYPDDQDDMLHKRIRYIVDLYLNTPDKAGFETPLHFACKFGCASVVDVLCSHPDIDKNCRNKYEQKPCDVICERMKDKGKVQEVKQKISEYLEDRCYVPLLRAADNSAQPVIGAPWSPEPMENRSPQLPRSPRDPVMAVRAFAGPLSPSKADEFRKAWKTPPRERAGHYHHILKSDPERGAERVGRELAREHGLRWAEYWDFLDGFVDLASSDGLHCLEQHLSRKQCSGQSAPRESGDKQAPSNRFRTPSPGKPRRFSNSVSVGAFLDEGGDVSLEELKNRQNAALTSISSASVTKDRGLSAAAAAMGTGGRDLNFHILPVSLSPPSLIEQALVANDDCDSNIHSGSDRLPNGSSSLPSPVSNLMLAFERMSLQDERSTCPRDRMRRQRRDGVAAETASGMDHGDNNDTSQSSEEYFLAEEELEPESERFRRTFGGVPAPCSRSRSWDHGSSSSGSSSGTYRSLERSCDLILTDTSPSPPTTNVTPPRGRKGLFIEGDCPSRVDREVLAAMKGVEVDPLQFPNVHKWKCSIQSYSSAQMQSWPSPAACRSQHPRRQTSTPSTPTNVLVSPVSRYSPGRYSPAHSNHNPAYSSYSPAHSNYSPASLIQRIRLKHFGDSPI